uniref:GEVED domain-containing protein n=1 Tax=Gelidibacter sp. TaxID=2018083 RepID=UPI00404B6343
MTKKLFFALMFLSATLAFSQQNNFWTKQSAVSNSRVKASKQNLPKTQTYSLNIEALKQVLKQAPSRDKLSKSSNVIVAFPNSNGIMESFRIVEASNLDSELQAKFPEIRSYAGQGIEDPTAVIRFSVSPLGFQSMRLSANQPASFIEAYSTDLSQYTVYKRTDRQIEADDFECQVTDAMNKNITGDEVMMRNADDGILRRYRLAVSTTGEYTAYHGGTKASALAAINATMTRVNGVFENDFNVTMVLIANNDAVIYTSSSSDPYTTSGSYNSQLQSTLTSVIGEANYDVGHLFARASNNGNAGCIGCICVNGQKGSGFTSRTDPEGDPFDIDYVAHEIGHQFGANHTWTFNGNEGTDAQMEPGSGSTIMGYAGITGATDVQPNSDPYFHARSIEQVTNYIKSRSCQTNINTGNAVPTANAGLNYTIPKGTPFVLTGSGTDANANDVLTYCWEQYDENNASTTNPSVNATTGVAFRSYSPSTDTKRYFPRLETIKAGATSWQWEAVPNVARTLNFRMTVRDNRAGGAANNSDDTVITVNGTAGPFVVSAPNTNVTWNVGTSQTVTWSVAGTTGNGVNAANVDILLSTDGGNTYPITLAANTPNDGSQAITVPNNVGTQNRVMVKGSNHIFFDISNTNFTIAGQVACTATVPTGLAASNVGSNSATLSWNAVAGATYDVQYRVVGTSTWTTVAVSGVSTSLSGLATSTQYEAQVRSKCSGGSNSAYSSSVNFTTTAVQLNYCASASTNTNDEYISRVQLNTINNPSGAQFYSNFTNISTTLNKSTQYTITVTPTWTGAVYAEGYSVWIDYNGDGDFTDAGEQVWTRAATNTTPVSGSFTVPAGATDGATRMRVSMKYNAIPTACETFTYGEVEDYSVVIQGAGPDVTAPSAPTNLTASGTTQTTTNLSWNASTDNVGVTGYDVYRGATLIASVTGTTYQATGLTASTTYTFSVRAKDAAGNISSSSNTVNVTTLSPPDTQAPSAPTNLTASGTTQTTTNLSWNASTDNVGVTGYDVYRGATLIASVTGTTYQATGLSPNTSYTFSVRAKDAAGNVSSTSNSVNVTTLVSTVTYCASQGNNTNDEWIQRVQLGSINNNSGNNGGYADFTSFSTTLVKGTSNTVTITPAWSGTVYREAYRVWIDYNQDGDFNDSGEQVYNRTRTNASVVSGSFTVPTSAVNGATRMRVSMKYNASPTSCETFAYGEVEDYTVIISASGAKDETIRIVDSAELSVYPNPVKGSQLNLVLKNAEATEVTIYNMIGQVVSKQAFNTTIDVSNLKGGIYIVEVIAGEQRLSKRFIKE